MLLDVEEEWGRKKRRRLKNAHALTNVVITVADMDDQFDGSSEKKTYLFRVLLQLRVLFVPSADALPVFARHHVVLGCISFLHFPLECKMGKLTPPR